MLHKLEHIHVKGIVVVLDAHLTVTTVLPALLILLLLQVVTLLLAFECAVHLLLLWCICKVHLRQEVCRFDLLSRIVCFSKLGVGD